MMPDVSPRRRSSRTTQLNQNSKSSSTSSTRQSIPDDSTKTANFDPNTTMLDQPPSDTSEAEQESDVRTRQTRRQKREQDAHLEPKASVELEDPDLDADEESGDDVTRCICRREHYPGPPIPLGANGRSSDNLDDDAGAMFISCDKCKVWQHGGCVGIMDQATTPENYYCELCRSDLHRVMQSAKGYKYSHYIPVVDATERSSSRTKSITKEAESRSSRERDNRSGSQKNLMPNGKRRSTMNSRAAYDEEEMIRLAVEESKGNGTNASSGSLKRRSKRARNDSDEDGHDLKRRKTTSDSASSSTTDSNHQNHDPASEDEKSKLTGKNGQTGDRARGIGTRAPSDKDVRRRDRERDIERAEAAGRRKGRAERRRGDDPEPVEEPPKPRPAPRAAASAQKSSRSQTSAKQTPSTTVNAPTTVSHKKGAKPSARRGKVGRNQYTKERDAIADARAEAARPSKSRDGEDVDGKDSAMLLPNGSKPSKPRHMNPNRVSLNELRKRVAGILEFISKTQVELAGDSTPPEAKTPNIAANNPSKSTVTRPRLSRVASVNSASKLSNEISRQAEVENDETNQKPKQDGAVADDVFKSMSSLQMMDALSRDIVHWQQQHGKWGEKS